MITQPHSRARFAQRLRRAPAHARDHDQRALHPGPAVLDGRLEHGLIQAGFTDRELGGVHTDRQPAGAGIDVVAGERTLAAPVEAARRVQSERVRGDHRAFAQDRQHVLRQIVSMHDAHWGCGQPAGKASTAAEPHAPEHRGANAPAVEPDLTTYHQLPYL